MPVTVKTRIGSGPESEMPIVDLARRLEDAGVAALTIHCRTAQMGHKATADWSWAARAREVVQIPVIVNGDIKTAERRAARASTRRAAPGVMVGRAAIEHPWIFREARALLDHGVRLPAPSPEERIAVCKEHLRANVEARGEGRGVRCTRRHLSGYLTGLPNANALRKKLYVTDTFAECVELLDQALHDIQTAASRPRTWSGAQGVNVSAV
jgi:tRNA-dihydrouridine synthase B